MFRRIMSMFMIPVLLLFSVCNVTFVHAEEADNHTDDGVPFKGYEFRSYEPGENDAKLYEEAGTLIYEIDKISLEDWQNKLFIDSGIVFEKGKQYTVDFAISASKDTYFSFFVNQIGAWNPVISEFLNIGDYVENYSYTTSVIGDDMAMEVLFQFGGGGNQAPLKISLLDFSIHEVAAEEEAEHTSFYRVPDFGGLSVSAEGADGSSLYIEGGGLVFETGEAGKVRVEDLSFKKGYDYEITYTVWADKSARVACSVDPKGGYFAPGPFVSLSGGPRTISRRTGIQQADQQMEITFDIDKGGEEPVKIIFDQIVIKEIKDGQEEVFQNAWVVDGFQLNHNESDGAVADLDMDEEGNVVYRIEKIGEHDWNNKVMIDKGVTFVKDNAYKVEISLESDKEMRVFFGVNPKNKWEPKIAETLALEEGVNEFSFATDTQAYDEDMEVLFQFGGFGNTAPCNIKMKAISIEPASPDDIAAVAAKRAAVMEPALVKEYTFSKLDNYKFKGFVMNDSSGSELYLDEGVLVYDIKSFGVNQLVKKDLWLSNNTEYNIEMKVSASRPMNLECFVSGRNTQKDRDKSRLTVGKSMEVIKAKFRTGNTTDDQGRIVFDLSNNEGSGKFYVHSVVINAVEEGIEETFLLEDVCEVHTDDKSNATHSFVNGGLIYDVKRFGGNPWENKITIDNITEFKRDKNYIVEFDMSSTESIVFTCVLRNLERYEDEDEWEYFWERNRVMGGKKQHFRFTFKALEDNPVNQMIFELGGQGNTKKGPANIFISDIKITECADYRKDKVQFSGAEGVFSSEHEGSLASGCLHQENGVLIYEIGREGIADWHNQLIFNQGVKFEKGYRYRIDVTASASGGANVKCAIVSQRDWKEKAKKYGILLNEESTLSFETDTLQYSDEDVEFSLAFGGMYNRSNTTIKISDIKIYKLSPGIPYTGTAIDDYDVEILYDNSDFYESCDFKGYTFNSTLIDNADASLYEEDGILHYVIREVGEETYHNKVSINKEMTAKADTSYQIEITARADEPSKFFFAMNGTEGGWDPLVAENIELTEDYRTYVYTTKSPDADQDVDLIFEFGANGNPAPNHVYIKDFKIREMKPIVDEGTVTFKGNDFGHKETGETAKGILYTNDNGNMVYYGKKLGNTPEDNMISMTRTLTGGKDSKIRIALKPQKGLNVIMRAVDAATGNELKSEKAWVGDNEEKEIALFIAAPNTNQEIELFIMFGQEEWADARGDNRIEFTDFSITESEPIVDEGTVTFGGCKYTHAEEPGAEGILYTDDDGHMVYYAKKLGKVDWHNKVSTVIENVEVNGEYTLTVEVMPEKDLDMVTTIPNAKNTGTGGDAWYKNWLAPGTSTKLSYRITAKSDTLEIFFQVGQEEFAEAREDNHIVFKSISLVKSAAEVDEGTVTIGGHEYGHTDTNGAEGILYTDENGYMVYYAKKLGDKDWHNKVSTTIENVEKGGQYTLTVDVEVEKGLNMVTTVPGAKNADGEGDAWWRDWLESNQSTTLTHNITVPDDKDTMEICFQVGQDEYKESREDNHIIFKSISLVKKATRDADTVNLDGYDFIHGEDGDMAKGSLYSDDDGNMVYYAEKLGDVDCHNQIIGTNMIVEAGTEYTLTVEVEAEKGLDMVTAIPDAADTKGDQETCFVDWLEPDTSTTLSYRFTAPGDTLEIFFRVGQEEDPEGREDNHIMFKSILLEENEAEPEEATPSNAEQKQEEGGTEDKQGSTGGGTEQNFNKEADVTESAEKGPEEAENEGGETEQKPEETGTGSPAPDSEEKEDTGGKESEGSV